MANTTPSFDVTPASSSTPIGTAIDFTVQAKDASNVDDPTYTGTVTFSSTDDAAALPADYTFTVGTDADNGMHTFQVTFNTPGDWTVTATDTADGTIFGSSGPVAAIGPLAPLRDLHRSALRLKTAGTPFTVDGATRRTAPITPSSTTPGPRR